MTRIFLWLFLAVVWAVASLGVLLPLLGIAWVAARLTDLTLAQAGLVTFGHTIALVYLLQTYLARRGFGLWFFTLWISILSLTIITLEGLLLHSLTDLTMFQAVIFVTGANLLVAYVFTHSLTGSIPPFLRGTVIEDLMEEELEEEVNLRPPPRRPHRRRK